MARNTDARPVTAAEIAAAAAALGLDVPIYSAERKGSQIVLHTRDGDHAYTPRPPRSSPRDGGDGGDERTAKPGG